MAGDWIPMRMELPDDPATISIAADTGLSEDAVVGKLLRIWSWANTHTKTGKVPGITPKWVDKHVGKSGFGEAMARAGWVIFDADGITFVKFEVYNGESAKKRLEGNRRVTKHRRMKQECNAESVTDAFQKALPEKRREEKRRTPPSEQGGVAPPPTENPMPSSPIPLSNTEARVRRWAGDAISASDRYAFAKAERESEESPPVTIHAHEHPASALFVRAVDEAIAAGGTYRSANSFLKLVGTIQARCVRDGVWPGEGLERTNGHAERSTAELLAIDKARRAK